ncbi:MAG: glycosyltransferase family 39 protein [Anaerolineae bacterium]|nr:glycosyltransferase family 39 protein [Anaerolineae bacterium]
MRHLIDKFVYLIFPLLGVLIAMLIPADKLALRILVIVVISSLAFVAADAKFNLRDLRSVSGNIHAVRSSVNRNRYIFAALLMISAFILLIFSAITFAPTEDNINLDFTEPIILMICGLIAMWVSIRIAPPAIDIAALANIPLTPSSNNLPFTLVGVALLLVSGEIAGHALFPEMGMVAMPIQGLIFYGGLFFLILGLGNVRLKLPKLSSIKWHRPHRDWIAAHSELIIVLLLFVGALVIRAWNLEIGLRTSVDEALAVDGVNHYYGGLVGLVGRPSEYIPTLLFAQWQGELIHLLGRSVITLRLTSAIVGSLTVVAVYFLSRDLFNDRLAGIIAALVLMTFPPHVHFSRVALLHIADPLFGTLAIWFFIRGIRGNQRPDWVLAGVSLGLTQYFFEAGRLFFVPLVAGWLILSVLWFIGLSLAKRLRSKISPSPKLPWKGIAIATFALMMVAMPTYYAAFSRGGDANPRLTTSGGFNLFTEPMEDGLTEEELIAMVKRVLFPFTVYVNQPEIAVFYGGDQPLILVFVVPFFLMGMGYLVWRWRSPAFIIALWVLATALINSLLRDSAVYARWHVVFPAVAITIAVAIRYVLPSVWRPLTLRSSAEKGKETLFLIRGFAVLSGGILAALIIGQLVYYFGWHVPLLEKQARLSKGYPDTFDMAIRSFDFPDYTNIYQISDPIADINVPRIWIDFMIHADPSTLAYLPLAAEEITQEFVDNLPLDRNLALFVDPNARAVRRMLVRRFGCEMQGSPYPIDPPDKAFLLCFVPASEPTVQLPE